MKSEFDKFVGLTYIKLREVEYFCLENQRYVNTGKDIISKLNDDYNRVEKASSSSIKQGNIDCLNELNSIECQLDSIVLKLALIIKYPNLELN